MRAVRKALVMIPAMMGVSLGGIVTSQAASAASYIVSDAPPPPPRIENVPHRDGYVWAPGHWESNGHSWAWVSGDYIVERRHAQWIPDGWEQAGAQWRYVPGHWQR
ncbi:MAG: hypothetical protein WAN26_07690 [Steroidobacteraceae bacterium]